ncbi:tyrosinase family protein [Nodularia sp. NIES-3585]|uniref:tyrosinase family protein n=1 Tax=Nodularia sp. NIES-3585 TaxID=1973477 RepID=UPI000B5CDFB3|nr:tyrosinase family protein [Nodularia sp. NIES-3585]GAX38429.1 tyrosinase [Nodularia sp. NIES-3585]
MTRLLRKSFTTVAISITTALSIFNTPAFAHNGEHHEQPDPVEPTPVEPIDVNTKLDIRKNVLDLNSAEKSAFVDALYTLKNTTLEGSTISIYDQFVAQHVASMGMMMMDAVGIGAGHDAAHHHDAFLPWHREYIHRFEKTLQSVNPNITLPYWDWTDPEAIDFIFQPDFLGTNGSGVILPTPGGGTFEGGPIQTGNFSEASGWVLNPNLHIDPITKQTSQGTSLIRFLKLPPIDQYPIPQAAVNQLLAHDNYSDFRLDLEGFAFDQLGNPVFTNHNYIHGLVGGAGFDFSTNPPTPVPIGTMSGVLSSPYDPVFWLLHTNVDRLWAEWQDNGHSGSAFYPASGQPYGHNLNDRMWPWDGGQTTPGMIGPGDVVSLLPLFSSDDLVTPKDTLNFRKYGYTYDTLVSSVPEPTCLWGVLALGILGTAVPGKQKRLGSNGKI